MPIYNTVKSNFRSSEFRKGNSSCNDYCNFPPIYIDLRQIAMIGTNFAFNCIDSCLYFSLELCRLEQLCLAGSQVNAEYGH